MANKEQQNNDALTKDQTENLKQVKENMQEGHTNPVNQALKKEKQPITKDDLSTIHDTHEVGTSGGDQREPDREETGKDPVTPGKPQKPIPVEEPGEGPAPDIIYEEPEIEPSINTEDENNQ